MPAKKKVVSPFGDNVVKINDTETGEVIAIIGVQNGQEKVQFSKLVTPDQLDAINKLVQKKKFNKHVSQERFDKAQALANRRFSPLATE